MTLTEEIVAEPDGQRIWHQERLIFEVTERLCELIEKEGVTRSALAERLGKSKGYVTQLLGGQNNMTLRTISDAFFALGRAAHISDSKATLGNESPCILRIHEATWADDYNDEPSVSVAVKM